MNDGDIPLAGRIFLYRRVGHDERRMTFLEGGLVGNGRAGCEIYWELVEGGNPRKLRIRGKNRSLTCELEWQSDDLWRGKWLIAEKMPVELVAVHSAAHPRAVIIQQADGEQRRMLELTNERHVAYAREHDFTYWQVQGELQLERGPMWNKIRLLFQAFEAGFDLAVWLDADTLIVDPSVNLRNAIREFRTIGMVKHPQSWKEVPWHFNTGAIFARNLDAAKEFLHEVWRKGDSAHPWWEQNRVMEALRDDPDAVQEIDRKWNSQPNCNPCERPVVRAWHGLRNRVSSMARELKKMS